MNARRRGRGFARLWLGGLAVSGIVAGHSLAFWFAVPDPHERSELLVSTGHRYWSTIVAIALGVLVAALSGLLVRMARRREATVGHRMFSFAAPRLAVLQVGGFLLLEAGERAVAHGDVRHLVQEPVVILGVVLQLAVALAAGIILAVLARAIRILRGRASLRPRQQRVAPLPRPVLRLSRPSYQLGEGGGTWRGPPPAGF